MARRSPLPPEPSAGADARTAIDDWLELQGDLTGLALGQMAQWQQAMWAPWIDLATAWWRLPADTSPFNPGLPFWLRGTEQLA